MTTRALPIALLAVLAATALAAGPSTSSPKATPDTELGLSRTSVFEAPAPAAFAYPDLAAGKSQLLPRAFPGAPPQVPHRIGKYLPITREDNRCADCHDDPDHFDGKVARGKPVPMPRSHYVVVATEEGETPVVSGRRHACVACHVAQSDAPDLVASTFDGPEVKR
jgi:cytochrome c-type protein NapB